MVFTEVSDIEYLPVSVVCSIGALANAMLLIALVKDPLKCFRNSATYLIGNLALSDLIFNSSMIPYEFAVTYSEGFTVLRYFSNYSSMGTIFSIALDRYFMVCHPFKHRLFMSGNRMALWIGMVWLLSSVHPIKMNFAPNKIDQKIKPCVGLILIILTAVFYGKTYYLLRKQAKSMLGKRSALSPEQSDVVSNKSVSSDAENCITNNAGDKENVSFDQTQNSFAKTDHEENPNTTVRCQNCGQFQSKNHSAENENYRAQDPHERAQSGVISAESHPERARNRGKRAESHSELAENCDQGTESHNERAQSHDERGQLLRHRGQNDSERAEGQLERFQILDDRYQNHIGCAESQNDVCDIPTRAVSSITKKRSTKKLKCPDAINSKEQKFLNTIIIIAFVAVITVVPGAIVFQYCPQVHKFFLVLIVAIYCVNFAANPFIYCWRLERYRKTFKMVFGCKT